MSHDTDKPTSAREALLKCIPGFPLYEVDENGNVYSSAHGSSRRKLMRPSTNGFGYRRVCLRKNGEKYYMRVSRIMLFTFVGRPPLGTEACHDNGIKTDDRIQNLRWGTTKSNAADRVRHGTQARGEDHGSAKLTVGEVKSMRALASQGRAIKSLARQYGVSQRTARRCIRRTNWEHVE